MAVSYEAVFGESPPAEVIDRSSRWRTLRTALANLEIGNWVMFPFTCDDGEDTQEEAHKARVACYGYSTAVGLRKNGVALKTYVQNGQDDGFVLWATKVPLES